MYQIYKKICNLLITSTLFIFPIGSLVYNWYRIGLAGGIETQGTYQYGIEFTLLAHTIAPIVFGLVAWAILSGFFCIIRDGI